MASSDPWAEDIEGAWTMASQRADEAISSIMPKPIGQQPVPPDLEHEEWLQNNHDPNWWAQRIQGSAAVVGPAQALLQALKFDKQMQEKANGRT